MTDFLEISTPKGFSFRTAATGHGWYDLPPFSFDDVTGELAFVFRDAAGRPVWARVGESGSNLSVRLGRKVRDGEFIALAVRHILRMDDDLSEFYSLTKKEESLRWVAKRGAGRMLRSQTVFEDLIKTICTTNCSWSLTRTMVGNIVSELGDAAKGGANAFPTPEAVADRSEKFFREVVRAGYRAPYFPELAKNIVAGGIDPESWLDPSIPIAELKKEIKSVKGVGDYAAENLLKLLGRYEGLALDSWLRAGFAKKHNGGKKCADSKIEKFYARFGKWKGLAIWCDMTERWF